MMRIGLIAPQRCPTVNIVDHHLYWRHTAATAIGNCTRFPCHGRLGANSALASTSAAPAGFGRDLAVSPEIAAEPKARAEDREAREGLSSGHPTRLRSKISESPSIPW